MAEEELKKAILEKIQKEKAFILQQARKEADEVLKKAKEDAAVLSEAYLTEIKKRCLIEQTRALNQINLEVKKRLLEAKEKSISDVFSLVKEGFKAIYKDNARYKSVFKHLLEEAKKGFDDDVELKLRVSPASREVALAVSKELNINADLEIKDSVDVGLELCDLEEGTTILNTFQSRLNKLMPELRQEVSRILFG